MKIVSSWFRVMAEWWFLWLLSVGAITLGWVEPYLFSPYHSIPVFGVLLQTVGKINLIGGIIMVCVTIFITVMGVLDRLGILGAVNCE